MSSYTYMDIPAVRDMAKTLDKVGEELTNVARILEALVNTLRTTAFISLVGGYAVAQFLEKIKPRIEKLAERCAELSQDVNASVDAYERGDANGATRFH